MLVSLYLIYKPYNLQGNLRVRFLDDGTDGTTQYNFVQFHFAFVGLTYQIKKIKQN